jgi:hypothetical protein
MVDALMRCVFLQQHVVLVEKNCGSTIELALREAVCQYQEILVSFGVDKRLIQCLIHPGL